MVALLARLALAMAFVAATVPEIEFRREASEPPSLPRFVSLKASRANLRVGPGAGYPIEWVFQRPGLPLEIFQQFGNWRRVRDWVGTSGWIYAPLLSGRRTGMVAPWNESNIALRARPSQDSTIIAWVEPRVSVQVTRCDGQWCAVEVGARSGYINQTRLWGVYPGEVL